MKTLAPATRHEGRLLQAMGLMCVYVALIVYVNACGKVMAESYHPFEVTLFRHGIAFLWMLILFAPRHGVKILVPKRPASRSYAACAASRHRCSTSPAWWSCPWPPPPPSASRRR